MHIERLMKKNKVGSMQWSPLLQSEFSIIIIAFCSLSNQKIILQSTLSKMDTYGTGTKCPSYRESNKGSKERRGPTLGVPFTEGVRLMESQIKGVKKGRTNSRCPFYRGVHLIESQIKGVKKGRDQL